MPLTSCHHACGSMVNNWSRLQSEKLSVDSDCDSRYVGYTRLASCLQQVGENKGPRQRQPDTSTQKILQDGRQKWRDRYGDQIKPQNRRSSYKQKAIPTENVSYNVITQFKTMPTITADSFITSRPLMGRCCSCVPYSQKDFKASTQNHGINNILNVTDGVRPKGFFDRRLKKLAYTFRRNTSHRYNDILMLVLTAPRVSEAVKMKSEKVTSIKRKEKIEKTLQKY
ncbi:unnamed protein product [Mytilus edulis]|uniref:Uncharacterized protein n=1 Tax=Mytilus edulis TaxID=6550 RepID=A0A8S3U5K2_MYTED|nr:unnamed protein product [Mytilus edulis]